MRVGSYELVTEWKNSQCGKTAIAEKGGKKYFLKRYQTPVAPLDNNALDEKTKAHNQELFDRFVRTRTAINNKIRAITGTGGNIIIPCDEFIDENRYLEAAELIEGVVDEDELEGVLGSLSMDVKKLLMQTATGALSSVHKLGIVHSDLKLKNVLLVRNAAGNYVAKLIDFDSSYFVDEKPDEIVGDMNYYSPELGIYSNLEDEEEMAEAAKKITFKSDIFSLGLIFHYYLCGEMPGLTDLPEKLKKMVAKGSKVYCWLALVRGGKLEVNPSIENMKYRTLIEDMLQFDPDKRPDAIEVLKRLKGEDPVIEEPWPEHGIVLDMNELKRARVIGLKKIADGGKKYELTTADGKKKIVDADYLGETGYLKKSCGFCIPWEEHNAVFDKDRIKSRGFVGVSRKTMGAIKGYKFYRADSTSTFFKIEMLIAMKYAVPAGSAASGAAASSAGASSWAGGTAASSSGASSVGGAYHSGGESVTPGAGTSTGISSSAAIEGICDPWPEHSIAFDEDMIRTKGYTGVIRDTMGVVKGYRFKKADGSEQFMRVEMICIQKLAKKV